MKIERTSLIRLIIKDRDIVLVGVHRREITFDLEKTKL